MYVNVVPAGVLDVTSEDVVSGVVYAGVVYADVTFHIPPLPFNIILSLGTATAPTTKAASSGIDLKLTMLNTLTRTHKQLKGYES